MNDEVSYMTAKEASDEFDIIAQSLETWLKRTAHLNIATILARDDCSGPGYMTFVGRSDRIHLMVDHIHNIIRNADESPEERMLMAQQRRQALGD